MNYESVRQQTKNAVMARPFTRVTGKPTYEQKEKFIDKTESGFYLGTAWGHYRCHVVWVRDARTTRVGQTVFFRHKYITQPAVTQTDAILSATDDLISVLKGYQRRYYKRHRFTS